MSQIAQALAKAKERTGHTTAPFATAGGVPGAPTTQGTATTEALRQAKNRLRFWLVVALVTLPLTGFVVWIQIRTLAPVETTAGSSTTVAPSAETSSASNAPATVPAKAAPPPPVKVVAPRPEIAQAVTNLAISAAMPGDPARIVLAGRVVRAGEVIEGGLTFVGIVDGHLQFNDAAGAVYTRRY